MYGGMYVQCLSWSHVLPPRVPIVLPHSMSGHVKYPEKVAYVDINFLIIITGAPHMHAQKLKSDIAN